jgi:hypothetical protein
MDVYMLVYVLYMLVCMHVMTDSCIEKISMCIYVNVQDGDNLCQCGFLIFGSLLKRNGHGHGHGVRAVTRKSSRKGKVWYKQ